MRFRTEDRQYITAFSYASLTDVVLQLLIFFLLSSSFVVQSGVKVELPKAAPAETETKSSIIVSVNEGGDIFINAEPVALDALPERVRALLVDRPDQMIILQADRTVSLQRAVEAMDAVKAGGGSRFLIATEPVDQE